MKKLNLYPIKGLKTKGFTLIEIIFGVAIFSILFLLISSFIFSSTKISNNIINYNQTNNELSYTVDYIFNEIDKADYIVEKSFSGKKQEEQLNLFIINKISKEYSITSFSLTDSSINRNNIKKAGLKTDFSTRFDFSKFSSNTLISDIKNLSASVDKENKILYLKITDKDDRVYSYSHYIRGRIYE